MNVGRVALVTGGSRGIGRAVALELARQGHAVAVNYRAREGAALDVIRTIESEGGSAMAVQADVSDKKHVDVMFEAVNDRFGPVEILVNNAGIRRDTLLPRMDDDVWQEVITTNLTSVYMCTKRALRHMLRARWGRVVMVGSVAGITGNPGQSNYSAAKAGVIGFAKSVAKEVGSRGITVNVVAPGFVETDMTFDLPDEVKTTAVGSIAVGRFGTPAEIASAVGYLASENASYISGQVLVVDGGLTL
jgi:3-oxoacyl-[acyl-carrier protein] reductase